MRAFNLSRGFQQHMRLTVRNKLKTGKGFQSCKGNATLRGDFEPLGHFHLCNISLGVHVSSISMQSDDGLQSGSKALKLKTSWRDD